MTLIIGMYYDNKKGALIASDSREVLGSTYGLVKKITLKEDLVFSIAGWEIIEEGFFDKFNQINKKNSRGKKDIELKEKIRETIKKLGEDYEDNPINKKRFEKMSGLFGFYQSLNPEIYTLSSNGVEPLEEFRTLGKGNELAQYLLGKIYHPEMSQEHAINVAVYSILETSSMYTGVDNNPQIALIDKKGIRILNYTEKGIPDFQNPEILKIKRKIEQISKRSRKYLDGLLINS